MTNNDDNNVDDDDHDDDNDDDTPFRSSLLARQDWGLGFGGGNHTTGARFARSRAMVTGPNPKPQSWLAAVTNSVHARTLTLTLTPTLTPSP